MFCLHIVKNILSPYPQVIFAIINARTRIIAQKDCEYMDEFIISHKPPIVNIFLNELPTLHCQYVIVNRQNIKNIIAFVELFNIYDKASLFVFLTQE